MGDMTPTKQDLYDRVDLLEGILGQLDAILDFNEPVPPGGLAIGNPAKLNEVFRWASVAVQQEASPLDAAQRE